MPKLSKHSRAVWMQEYLAAQRNVKNIKIEIKKGNLEHNHPSLKINQARFERAKQALGVK